MEVALRIPRPKAAYVVVIFAAIAFPLIWWGPPLLVALGAALGLAALFWIAGVPSPSESAPASEPANTDAPSPPATLDLGSITATHRTTASIAGVAIALMALVSGIDDPVLSVKIALSSLLVSRALLALLPAQLGELARIPIAHAGALVATTLMLEPSGVLTCVLWQSVWLAIDFSRVHFITAPQTNADAAATNAATAEAAGDAQTNPAPLVSGETNGDGAPAQVASSDLPTPANDTQPEASIEISAEPPPKAETQHPLNRNLARSAGAWAAALAIIALISLGFVETVAPRAPQQTADASPEPAFDELWNQAPWTDRQPAYVAPHAPPPAYGSRAWACAQTSALEARGLHTLTAQTRANADTDADDDWAPAVLNFDTPPLAPAAQQVANHAFGAPCADAENTRVISGAQLRAASGYRSQEGAAGLIVVGAVHALDLPDGRRLLLARGWSDNGEPAPSHLLMSWATTNDEAETPTIWIVSSKGSMGVAGVLFAPADQPLGGYHLWYGAMGDEAARSASSADIIDVSGSAPRNTGAIPIWGASTCGQVPGDLLQSAEPDCAEEPAWAFWLTDFAYAPGGADEVMLTWRVRRQVGAAGEPAIYEEAYESNMRGRFVLSGGRWRFMDGEGALIADAGFELALNETGSQE
jgi:hypothetical protein